MLSWTPIQVLRGGWTVRTANRSGIHHMLLQRSIGSPVIRRGPLAHRGLCSYSQSIWPCKLQKFRRRLYLLPTKENPRIRIGQGKRPAS